MCVGFTKYVGDRDVGHINCTYRAALRPIQRAFDLVHRPVGYIVRATSMRWKISIHDAVIAIEPSDPTRGREEGSSYRDDMPLEPDDAWS